MFNAVTPEELGRLQALCDAAMRGDWQVNPAEFFVGDVPKLIAGIHELQRRADDDAMAIAGYRADLEEERYHHAACLSIAEGAPGWQDFDAKHEAAKAVKRLRIAALDAVNEADQLRAENEALKEHS